MKRFTIQVNHETSVAYIVLAESFEAAKDKLYGKEIWTGYGNETVGVNHEYCLEAGIEVYDFCPDGDPSPTGKYCIPTREWEWDEEWVEEKDDGLHPEGICEDAKYCSFCHPGFDDKPERLE